MWWEHCGRYAPVQEKRRADPCARHCALHATAHDPIRPPLCFLQNRRALSNGCCHFVLSAGDVFEIGRRFPHEIEVASSMDGSDPVHYVYVAAVDSHDPEVAPGIGALTRYKHVG